MGNTDGERKSKALLNKQLPQVKKSHEQTPFSSFT